ncbi:hypothetical protein CL653_02595 [bacterium]|nr:hypothetical protein [bacterium]
MEKFRTQNFDNKYPSVEKDLSAGEKIGRRQALRGLLATLGVSLVPIKLSDGEVNEGIESEGGPYSNTEESILEYDELSHSGFFQYNVEYYESVFAEELPQISDRLESLQIIKDNFDIKKIPEPMAGYLEDLVLGMAIEESRLDTSAVSKDKAFGILQLMPATWEELALEGESKENMVDQIKVAARLLEQSYLHLQNTCSQELKQIRDTFFNGDEQTFINEFYTPLLLNAYNAGMGSMATLVRWFVTKFKNPKDTVELFEQSEVLTGYDVFLALAHGSTQEEVVSWYKDDSSTYTTKIYGAKIALEKYRASLAD